MNPIEFFNLIFTYPIFNVLILLYHLFGDLALSIIVLTVMIRLVLFPLTVKQLNRFFRHVVLISKVAIPATISIIITANSIR